MWDPRAGVCADVMVEYCIGGRFPLCICFVFAIHSVRVVTLTHFNANAAKLMRCMRDCFIQALSSRLSCFGWSGKLSMLAFTLLDVLGKSAEC